MDVSAITCVDFGERAKIIGLVANEWTPVWELAM